MATYLSAGRKLYMRDGKLLEYTLPLATKGDLLSMNLDGNGNKTYRVLSMNGDVAKLLSMDDTLHSKTFNTTSKTGTFINGTIGQLYAGSDLDTFLNTTWYNTLLDTVKAAIVPESRTQYMYQDIKSSDITENTLYQYEILWSGDYRGLNLIDKIEVNNRNVFALDLKDIYEYFGKNKITSNELLEMWTSQTESNDSTGWLSSTPPNSSADIIYCVNTVKGRFSQNGVGGGAIARPAFNINLSKIAFTKV